jgi:3-oxocholest-4-en-26-oate---CoA ligase
VNENYATVWEALSDEVGDRVAIVHGDTERTWRDFDERASRLASAMASFGVGHGSYVAIAMWNCPENLESLFAAFKLRAIPFNLNYRYRETELSYIFNDAKASVVIFDPQLAERIELAAKNVDHPMILIETGDTVTVEGAYSFEQLIAENEPAERIARSGDDEAIIYTGGTTGYPKGVIWPHYVGMNQGAAGQPQIELDEHVAAVKATEPPRSLVIPPMMHATGFFGATGTLSRGGAVVFYTSRSLNPDEILGLIGKHRIASFSVIGDAIAKPLLDALDKAEEEGHPYDLSSVQTIGNTGVIWSAPIKKGFLKHGNFVIRDSIASTEGSGFATVESSNENEVETGHFKLGPNARVVDEDLHDIVPGSGQVGYLATTGLLPKGYLNDPEKSAKTWPTIDGKRYSMPGDMATIEVDGTVVLMGRGSEVVNTGGEKVFVEEVEQALLTHPAVKDTLVVGLPDERWGSRVTAVVELEAGAEVSERELIDHVGLQLADYKRPRQVVFVDEVPRSPTGKADRKTAKEKALEKTS